MKSKVEIYADRCLSKNVGITNKHKRAGVRTKQQQLKLYEMNNPVSDVPSNPLFGQSTHEVLYSSFYMKEATTNINILVYFMQIHIIQMFLFFLVTEMTASTNTLISTLRPKIPFLFNSYRNLRTPRKE